MRIMAALICLALTGMAFADHLTAAPISWQVRIMSFLTNANIAYILMMITIFSLSFVFIHPRSIGTLFAGCLFTALTAYIFYFMQVNYIGLALILFGILLLIAETRKHMSGFLAILGVIIFIIGSAILFDTTQNTQKISWTVIFFMTTVSATFFLMVFDLANMKSKKKSAK